MGKVDTVMKNYLQDKARFADLFNGVFFGGRQVILPQELSEASESYVGSREVPYLPVRAKGIELSGEKTKSEQLKEIPTQQSQRQSKPEVSGEYFGRVRDIKMRLRQGTTLRILALENQNYVDYTMPYRCMEYDALEYGKQLKEQKRKNKEKHRLLTIAEKLCGFCKKDRLVPVYTICLYHGEEKWDGPLNLKDMMDFGADKELCRFFADYPLRLFCVNEQDDFGMFHTELRELFELLNCRKDRKKLRQRVSEREDYRHLSPETAETLSVLLNMPQLWEERNQYMKETEEKEEYDMCQALREWSEEERAIGRQEGISQGNERKTNQVIRNMLARGYSDEDICVIAECTVGKIEEVRQSGIQ